MTGLLPLEEVMTRLPVHGRSASGVRTIRVDRIVGSVDRAPDFDRHFTPRLPESRRRLTSLAEAFPDGDLPAISVVEVGGLYFVVDGHHRVALTRQRGGEFIEAEVVHVEAGVELPPDIDLRRLADIGLQRRFVEESGLDITLSDAAGYAELLDAVKAYGWDRAVACRCFPDRDAVAAGWRDEVFEPGVRAMRRAGPRRGTEGDAFLALHHHRRQLRAGGRPSTDDDAARAVARRGLTRWTATRRTRSGRGDHGPMAPGGDPLATIRP